MNKNDLINELSTRMGCTKADAGKFIQTTTEIVHEALVKGEKVQIVGTGSLQVVTRAARKGVNPQTKKAIKIPAKKVVKFKTGKDLAEKVK